MSPIRIALVQYDPIFGEVARNICQVDVLLAGLKTGSIDILLLPEMAFTGYMMDCLEEAHKLAEVPNEAEQPTIDWAKRTSARLQCHTVVGFPEWDADSAMLYNSLLLVDANGDVQHVYRKHFLFDTDKRWAQAGDGFHVFELELPRINRTITVSPAICMDLNPKDFVAPFEAYEFATFCKDSNVGLVLCAMNWLASEPPLQADAEPSAWEQVKETISYWALRLSPLFGTGAVFAGCNRVGTERGTTFTGSSCVMRLADRPEVVDCATKTKEELLIVEIDIS